jgi:hypothetical protein
MGFSEIPNKVHAESKLALGENDDHNSPVAKFCARHLKRKFCEAYYFSSRVYFSEERKGLDDAGDLVYEWPKDRIHSMARETHAALNLRFPVPNDQILTDWVSGEQNQSEYHPYFATEEDKHNYSDQEFKNPCGRFVASFLYYH